MALSKRRREALYRVIHEGFVDLRLRLLEPIRPGELADVIIADAGERIAQEAIRVMEAGGENG